MAELFFFLIALAFLCTGIIQDGFRDSHYNVKSKVSAKQNRNLSYYTRSGSKSVERNVSNGLTGKRGIRKDINGDYYEFFIYDKKPFQSQRKMETRYLDPAKKNQKVRMKTNDINFWRSTGHL